MSGLHGKPTCINNVETLVNIPMIVEKGPDWFKQLGTEITRNQGICVGWQINIGLVEVPMELLVKLSMKLVVELKTTMNLRPFKQAVLLVVVFLLRI